MQYIKKLVSPNVFMYFEGNKKIMKYRRHHKVLYNNVPFIAGTEI